MLRQLKLAPFGTDNALGVIFSLMPLIKCFKKWENHLVTNLKKIKIGIDAKWFFEGPPSGRNVVRNLVEHIIEQNVEHEIYIFLDQRMRNLEFPFKSPLVRLIYLWGNNNLLSNLFIFPWKAWRLKLDVVIFQNFVPVLSNFRRLAIIYDVIFLSHPQYFTRKERIYLYPIKLLSRFASQICTISQSEKNRIVSYCGIAADKIEVMYLGVSPIFRPKHHFDAEQLQLVRQKYNLPENFLLYVGRLNERKNILNLLKSVPMLENNDIVLILVGSYDWKMFDINKVVRELGLEKRVQLTGFVSDDDLPLVFSLATLFWFVSYEEGFGLPPLESMAAGVPVIVSDRSSLPEVCGDAGNYADPDSPRSIADAIDRLLKDKNLYEEKRRLGLNRAQKFKWWNSSEKLMQSAVSIAERGKK